MFRMSANDDDASVVVVVVRSNTSVISVLLVRKCCKYCEWGKQKVGPNCSGCSSIVCGGSLLIKLLLDVAVVLVLVMSIFMDAPQRR